jgi:hypothetical protein
MTVMQIEERTQINRRQLYCFIERSTDTHADGRPFGFRALVRYTHVIGYERMRPAKAALAPPPARLACFSKPTSV